MTPSTKNLGILAALGLAFLAATDAQAVPAFARKTGMACSACHVSWPKLNDFGEAYRDRGYRIQNGEPEPNGHPLDYVPVALRSTAGYQGTVTTHQATDLGQKTVRTGGMLPPAADLIIGANLSRHLSVFVVASGFADDGLVSLESDWARINDIGTDWVNLKVGRHELDLPVSEHRSYTLTSDFAIYHYHPAGSVNGFSIGDNQLGVELAGHGDGPGLRYAASLVSVGGNPGGGNGVSSPALYAHANWTVLPDSALLQRVRVGVLGDRGYWPTEFSTLATEPVPGTGTANKPYLHAGVDASVTLGPLSRPFDVTAVWLYGTEDKALVPGATRDAAWQGGFLQADFTPRITDTVYARVDFVQNVKQADPTLPKNANGVQGIVGGVRHAVWLSPWGSAAVHLEASHYKTENAGPAGEPVSATTVLAGLDFAL